MAKANRRASQVVCRVRDCSVMGREGGGGGALWHVPIMDVFGVVLASVPS